MRQFFSDNLTLDQKVDLLRDENLGLKSKLFHALCGISDSLSEEDEELELEEQQEVIGGLFGDLRRLNRRNGRLVESRRTTRMRSGRTTNTAVSLCGLNRGRVMRDRLVVSLFTRVKRRGSFHLEVEVIG